MGGCQEKMRRGKCAAPQPTAARQGARRTGGRAVEERRSGAGVDEDLVVAPSGGEAVEKERHRGRPRGPGLGMSVGSPMAQDALDHGGVFDHRNELQAAVLTSETGRLPMRGKA